MTQLGLKFDMVRVDVTENGFIISARKQGVKPQSYAYTDRWVAKTWAEVLEVLSSWALFPGAVQSSRRR